MSSQYSAESYSDTWKWQWCYWNEDSCWTLSRCWPFNLSSLCVRTKSSYPLGHPSIPRHFSFVNSSHFSITYDYFSTNIVYQVLYCCYFTLIMPFKICGNGFVMSSRPALNTPYHWGQFQLKDATSTAFRFLALKV